MKALVVAGLVVGLALTGASPALADEKSDDLQQQIDEILAAHPGGKQISSTEISWDRGQVVLTLAGASPQSVGSCATGFYCAYNAAALGGSKISFSACSTTVSTAALPGIVRSMANARSTGYVQGQNSSGTTLVTVNAGASNGSTPVGITQIRCVP